MCEGPYSISLLTTAHPKYAGVKQQFLDSWVHPGPKPSVRSILQVRNSPAKFGEYESYSAGLSQSNEVRRFHGTSMKCNFGIDRRSAPCDDDGCAVCTICQASFKLDHSGGGPLTGAWGGRLRYGRGLYFSKASSKSNDYAAESERVGGGARMRCVFLCKVALGRAFKTPRDGLDDADIDLALKVRGHGGAHDSLVGLTAAEGGALNYDETVVYSERAAIPSYLIVYALG